MKLQLLTLLLSFSIQLFSQANLYFPPKTGNGWDTIDPADLGWKTDELPELQTFLSESGTKSFLVLKDGKIVLEYYFNGHDESKPWYWASAGKSLTSILVAFAEAENKLELTDPSSKYLGKGWTTCSEENEDKITVWNQITMTSGLDDAMCFDCLDAPNLNCIADPGTRWAYHNSPYTLLDGVIEGATGKNLNLYFKEKLGDEIGMQGLFVMSGNNNVFYSTGRSAARFGLFTLANGYWDGKEVLKNPTYITNMKNSSQNINPSYGYLWWLNGKGKVMLPGVQVMFNRDLNRFAPKDMFAALGKNDQKIYVVPSENLVVVRLGELGTANDTPVPIIYDEDLWERLKSIMNLSTATMETPLSENESSILKLNNDIIEIDNSVKVSECTLFGKDGKPLIKVFNTNMVNISQLPTGIYFAKIVDSQNIVKVEKIFIP